MLFYIYLFTEKYSFRKVGSSFNGQLSSSGCIWVRPPFFPSIFLLIVVSSDELEHIAAEEEYKIFKASTLKNTYFNKYKTKLKEIETCTFQSLLYTSDTPPISCPQSPPVPKKDSWTSAKNLLNNKVSAYYVQQKEERNGIL